MSEPDSEPPGVSEKRATIVGACAAASTVAERRGALPIAKSAPAPIFTAARARTAFFEVVSGFA